MKIYKDLYAEWIEQTANQVFCDAFGWTLEGDVADTGDMNWQEFLEQRVALGKMAESN